MLAKGCEKFQEPILLLNLGGVVGTPLLRVLDLDLAGYLHCAVLAALASDGEADRKKVLAHDTAGFVVREGALAKLRVHDVGTSAALRRHLPSATAGRELHRCGDCHSPNLSCLLHPRPPRMYLQGTCHRVQSKATPTSNILDRYHSGVDDGGHGEGAVVGLPGASGVSTSGCLATRSRRRRSVRSARARTGTDRAAPHPNRWVQFDATRAR